LKAVVFLAAIFGAAQSVELTPTNFDSVTGGKTAFIKFYAPWCGHCKKMKPDWDKLMTEYKDHASILVADVDCTASGKPLCDANGVKGFPTLKHGDPNNLEEYQGGRELKDLKAFAAGLKPSCSPAALELCNADQKAKIAAIQAMSAADLSSAIADGDAKIAKAEEDFKNEVAKLQSQYEALGKTKGEDC